MLQEIYEQPEVVRRCLAAYLRSSWDGTHSPIALNLPDSWGANLEHIQILACGTSWHAGLVGQYWLEQIAGISTQVRTASEFVSAPLPPISKLLTIAVTQSGETADTLAAVKLAIDRGSGQSTLLGITNQSESTLTQLVDYTLPTLAGAEVGVAATKTFLTQLVVFCCLALDLAYQRQTITNQRLGQLLAELRSLPDRIKTILQNQTAAIQKLAQTFSSAENFVILGRGISRAIALEGALKLKETTYIHAEGYAAGEFMHGPIAMLDAKTPVVVLTPAGSVYQTMMSHAQQVKQNGAPVIEITTASPLETATFDYQLALPTVDELLSPFLTVIPLQLLAYYMAIERGLNVDKPRNITKTLT